MQQGNLLLRLSIHQYNGGMPSFDSRKYAERSLKPKLEYRRRSSYWYVIHFWLFFYYNKLYLYIPSVFEGPKGTNIIDVLVENYAHLMAKLALYYDSNVYKKRRHLWVSKADTATLGSSFSLPCYSKRPFFLVRERKFHLDCSLPCYLPNITICENALFSFWLLEQFQVD